MLSSKKESERINTKTIKDTEENKKTKLNSLDLLMTTKNFSMIDVPG